MASWALVESDFRREYRLGLAEVLALPWAMFLRLLAGLSADSRWMMLLADRRRNPVLEGEETDRYLASQFGA